MNTPAFVIKRMVFPLNGIYPDDGGRKEKIEGTKKAGLCLLFLYSWTGLHHYYLSVIRAFFTFSNDIASLSCASIPSPT